MAIKGQKPKVYDFLYALDYAVCHGPVDSYNELTFRDKVGFVGPVTVDGASYIEKNELFGGDDGGEGGISGTVEFYLGGWFQKVSSNLAGLLGLTPNTAPGYRGVAHVFFHGSRPPGEEDRSVFTVPITGNYSGSMQTDGSAELLAQGTGSSANFTELADAFPDNPISGEAAETYYRLYTPPALGANHQYSELVILDASDLAIQIDSGLGSFAAYAQTTSPTTGSNVWAGGIAIACYDAYGNQVGYASDAADDASHPPGTTTAAASLSIPATTRIIRWRFGVTRNINGVNYNYAELQLRQGWLTNYFGDTYEFLGNEDEAVSPRGFKWSTGNPYLQPPVVNATRSPKGLTGVDSLIYPITGTNEHGVYLIAGSTGGDVFERDDDRDTQVFLNNVIGPALDRIFGPLYQRQSNRNEAVNKTHLPDANPACMIYECMTNSDWGKGDPPEAFDTQSYIDAANTLADENFGLSMLWNGQAKIEEFVGEVLDHIKGMQFQDPATGLWTLKLLRDDYDTEDCLLFDESNSRIQDVKTTLWGETINKIIVTYTDPESEEEATVEETNLANVAIQGGVSPDTRDYHGIRNPWLAKIVCQRDLAEASATLTSCVVHVPRSEGPVRPGDVIELNHTRIDVVGFFRVNEVDPGSSKAKTLKLTVVEDVFSVSAPTRAVTPVEPPANPDLVDPAAMGNIMFMSAPYFMLTQEQRDTLTEDEVVVMVMASDNDRHYSDVSIQYFTDSTTGGTALVEAMRSSEWPLTALEDPLVAEARSEIDSAVLEAAANDAILSAGQYFFVGNTDATHEVIALESYNGTSDRWTVLRGVHDTVPLAHEAGTDLRRGTSNSSNTDPIVRDIDEDIEYYVLPRTFSGQRLDYAFHTPDTYTTVARQGLPYRPANIAVDGNDMFTGGQYLSGTIPATLDFTWANRDKDAEIGPIVAWDADNVTPPAGQTITIRFWAGENFDVLDHEVTGLTGTSTTISTDDFSNFRFCEVEFVAVEGSAESAYNGRVALEIERLGYGNNYGYDYGENDGD